MATKSKSKYDLQAEKFLEDYKLELHLTICPPAMQSAPKWAKDGKHGTKYRVQIYLPGCPDKGCLSFDFWGSYADKKQNEMHFHKKHPSKYDILACISSDSYCPDTFGEFCIELGYDIDSIRAKKTFKRCRKFSRDIREFFTTDELNQLREIQ
jgi:hypothetical protein